MKGEMIARTLKQLKGWRLVLVGGAVAVFLTTSAFVLVPAVSPSVGADTADFLRSIIGPGPVAELESASFWLHDLLNRFTAGAGLGAPQVAWANGTTWEPMLLPGGINILHGKALAKAEPGAKPAWSGGSKPAAAPRPVNAPVVVAAPQIGWQAYGPDVNGTPVLARTMLMVDPQRSYAGVALVRMDLGRLSVHMTPGTIEPAHPSGIDQKIPVVGMVPPAEDSSLVAAFNGGFKALHGHYGMMVDGLTLLPPIDGMATLAIYKDGSVRVGAWGTDITQTPDMVSFRQNCPPLIDNGAVNPLLATDSRKLWGLTNNSDITWRTAVGITRDGRYLIYAVGNGTNADFLAQALQQAGAYNAMQLDINQYYAHFVTFAGPGDAGLPHTGLSAERLLQQMIDEPQIYLTPQVRDFFYVTAS